MKSSCLTFILLMLLTTVTVFAADLPSIDQNQRIIQMDGHGDARANPDQASVSFAIETKASSARDAGAENAQIAQKVIATLKAKVGAGGKVQTANYALSPVYAIRSGPQPITNGWKAWNIIRVECDPSLAGGVLDTAHAVGAEGTSDTDPNSGKSSIAMNVEASALTANDASRKIAEKARAVVDKIKARLGGSGTVKIEQGRVEANVESLGGGGQTQEIIGYQASNLITAETGAIDQVGSLIDAAIAAGATRAEFANFNLRDDTKARSDAIADACNDAQLKANAAAQALGLKIKRVMRITSVSDFRPQGGYSASLSQASVVGTPIKPGQISVPATVTVTYELE